MQRKQTMHLQREPRPLTQTAHLHHYTPNQQQQQQQQHQVTPGQILQSTIAHNKSEVIDGEPVGECIHPGTHAQTNGQPQNIMPLAPSVGWVKE